MSVISNSFPFLILVLCLVSWLWTLHINEQFLYIWNVWANIRMGIARSPLGYTVSNMPHLDYEGPLWVAELLSCSASYHLLLILLLLTSNKRIEERKNRAIEWSHMWIARSRWNGKISLGLWKTNFFFFWLYKHYFVETMGKRQAGG